MAKGRSINWSIIDDYFLGNMSNSQLEQRLLGQINDKKNYHSFLSQVERQQSHQAYLQQIANSIGGLSNGNWQAATQAYSNTINGAGVTGSAQRTKADAIAAYLSSKGYPYPGALADLDTRPVLPLKDAGVMFGELVGHRIWRVKDKKLRAFWKDIFWEPGVPMSAHALEGLPKAGLPSDHGDDGIWAFKERKRAILKAVKTEESVFGTVKLWGKVIECEDGYRAEMASIVSLDGSLSLTNIELRELSELYIKKEAPPCD